MHSKFNEKYMGAIKKRSEQIGEERLEKDKKRPNKITVGEMLKVLETIRERDEILEEESQRNPKRRERKLKEKAEV